MLLFFLWLDKYSHNGSNHLWMLWTNHNHPHSLQESWPHMSVWIFYKIPMLRLSSFFIFFTYFPFMHSLHCSKSESSNGERIPFLTCLSILPLEIWPKRQCHNFDNTSWALLCHLFQINTLDQLLYQLSGICLWRASELTLYSIEVLGDRVIFWDWAHNYRFNHVLYHSQNISCWQWPTSYAQKS